MTDKTAIVVSDNHADKECLEWLKNNYPNADYFIHAGDSELSDSDLTGWVCVKGNHDYTVDFPEERILTINSTKILLVHGHRFWGLMLRKYNDLAKYTKEKECTVVIHGHTHLYQDETVDSIRILNPGSIALPREQGLQKTYMILTIGEEIRTERKVYIPAPKPKKTHKHFWQK